MVIDASVALKWVIPEPDSGHATALRNQALHAPDLLLAEAGNALWKAVRRGLAREDDAALAFGAILSAPIRWFETGPLSAEAFPICLALDHPIYDCVYLALARQLGMRLVTCDRRLLRRLSNHPEFAGQVVDLADI